MEDVKQSDKRKENEKRREGEKIFVVLIVTHNDTRVTE